MSGEHRSSRLTETATLHLYRYTVKKHYFTAVSSHLFFFFFFIFPSYFFVMFSPQLLSFLIIKLTNAPTYPNDQICTFFNIFLQILQRVIFSFSFKMPVDRNISLFRYLKLRSSKYYLFVIFIFIWRTNNMPNCTQHIFFF